MRKWCILIVFAGSAAVATSLLAVDDLSWDLSPDAKLILTVDRAAVTVEQAVLVTRSFDFTFPSGWKIDVSDVGFVYASVAKDSTPMIAISSCSMFRSREDCVATTRDVRARFLTSPWKGETSSPTKAERSDNVEEYTRYGTDVLSQGFLLFIRLCHSDLLFPCRVRIRDRERTGSAP
jgi:hypothetical protein